MDKKNFKKLLEPKIYNLIDDSDIQEFIDYPVLTFNRLDLAFKLIYLEQENIGKNKFFSKCYEKHIACFTYGTFIEHDSNDKDSLVKYESDFDNIAFDISRFGFDCKKSIVPLAIDGSILNGAHRVSAGIYYDKKINFLKTSLQPACYNYEYFKKRGLDVDILEFGVEKFFEHSKNSYLAIIWPSAEISDKLLDDIFDKVIYKKKIELSFTGSNNIISEAYRGASWLAEKNTIKSGSNLKHSKCFESDRELRVIFFQSDSFDDVLSKKEKVRELCKIGKHSIHITDNYQESLDLSRVLLNNNSIHAMNNSESWQSCNDNVSKYISELHSKNVDTNKYIVISSTVLEQYNIRKSNDLDYVTISEKLNDAIFDEQSKDLEYCNISKKDLIFDPNNYFWCNNIKYMSLFIVEEIKKHRKSKKDIIDVKLINALKDKSRNKILILNMEQKFLFWKMKLKFKTLSLIKFLLLRLGLFDLVKKLINKI